MVNAISNVPNKDRLLQDMAAAKDLGLDHFDKDADASALMDSRSACGADAWIDAFAVLDKPRRDQIRLQSFRNGT
jgi:hypothetical protein